MKASEQAPIAPAVNVRSELLQAETNALLRELIEEVRLVCVSIDSVDHRLKDGITTYEPR